MAARARRLESNVAGEFYVDSTCIDCDACRWIAPETFDRSGELSRVRRQPGTAEERARAFRALIACPVGSIGADTGGATSKEELSRARDEFPVALEDRGAPSEVHHCGWHSRDSFGAASWLIVRPRERGGNVLVDSPRFSEPLARRIEALGGVATMFLTHGDDVADHARFADRFGALRVMHEGDLDERTRGLERPLAGLEPVRLDDELLAIPTPGHTRGSACLLYRDRWLFTGDHLAWSERRGHLYAFRDACWFDWRRQIASMELLREHRFERVLPGHGRQASLAPDPMRESLERCLAWMRAVA
jgi:glyoxylase-like metal-dependent hydrolase (beta-lactamase superfamily II)/ferredoxin